MPSGAAVIRYEGKRGLVYRIKFQDATGRQVMETLGREADGWSEQRAKAELRERLVRVERKAWRKPAPLSFAAYAEAWYAEAEQRRRWAPASSAGYRYALRRLEPHLGPLRLAAVRPRHVAAYVSEALAAGYSPATVNLDVGVIYDICASAKREELLDSNPAEHVERPRAAGRRWRILEPAEVARVASAFEDEQARAMFLVLTRTGLRRHELLALRWRDIDFVEEALRVHKSKTRAGERSIALSGALLEELWQHRRRTPYAGDDERVFYSEGGGPYSARRWARLFRAALQAAGIEGYVRPFHDLRHSALTNEAAAGSNPIALMTKAGHGSMETTQHYLHLAGVVFRDEAEALERRLGGGAGVSTDVYTDPA